MYVDRTGTEPVSLTIGAVAAAAEKILLIAAIAAIIIVVANPTVRDTVIEGIEAVATTVATWVEDQKAIIVEKMTVSLAKAASKKSGSDHVHHIVAQSDPRAANSRFILELLLEHGVNNVNNLVSVDSRIHHRLHTNAYFLLVEHTILSAFMSAKPNRQDQTERVTDALQWLKGFIQGLSAL